MFKRNVRPSVSSFTMLATTNTYHAVLQGITLFYDMQDYIILFNILLNVTLPPTQDEWRGGYKNNSLLAFFLGSVPVLFL